jgi:hypothetical protein
MSEIMCQVIEKIVIPVCLFTPLFVLIGKMYNNTVTPNDLLVAIVFLLFGILVKLLTFDKKG